MNWYFFRTVQQGVTWLQTHGYRPKKGGGWEAGGGRTAHLHTNPPYWMEKTHAACKVATFLGGY